VSFCAVDQATNGLYVALRLRIERRVRFAMNGEVVTGYFYPV
jgi:hypothetical protein